MKRLATVRLWLGLAAFVLLAAACTRVYIAPPGPPGRDGRAFFGIDFDYQHPYSYWDNNPAIPNNPAVGQYYGTFPGLYEFEYFINPHEYWYGTYEIWINPGTTGQPNGVPGIDGMDTYLLFICNPEGFYEERFNSYKRARGTANAWVWEGENFKVTLQKTTVNARTPRHSPEAYAAKSGS